MRGKKLCRFLKVTLAISYFGMLSSLPACGELPQQDRLNDRNEIEDADSSDVGKGAVKATEPEAPPASQAAGKVGEADVQSASSTCRESMADACGPFSAELISLCKARSGGNACDSNRWNKVFYEELKSDLKAQKGSSSNGTAAKQQGAPMGDSFGVRFVASYKENYETIKRDIGSTKKACALFVSEALSRNGIAVDRKEAWAQKVSTGLQAIGWKKITDSQQLLPGDVIFTADADTFVDGQSPHVFVFEKYGATKSDAIAIDNQGNSYVRSLNEGVKYDAFWYAYRNPE